MDDKTSPPAPDYTALAQRYLELWQDQVARLAKDPPKEMGDLTAMTAAWSKMAASMSGTGAPGHEPGAHRPPSAAPAHGDGGMDRTGRPGGPDAATAARLSALEQRIAALESQLAALAPPDAAKPVKPRAAGGGRGARKKP